MANVSKSPLDVNGDGKVNIDDLLDGIAKSSPLLVMFTAAISFILLIIFESDYYGAVLAQRWHPAAAKAIGIAVSIVREFARAVLLVMTFSDFRKGNALGAWLGLVISLSLVMYDIFSASPISHVWSGDHTGKTGMIVVDLLVFLVSLSFVLEFRLVLSGKANKRQASNAVPGQQAALELEHYKNLAKEYANANEALLKKQANTDVLEFEEIDLKSSSKNGNGVH